MEFVNLFNIEMTQTQLKYLYKAKQYLPFTIRFLLFFNLLSTADLS